MQTRTKKEVPKLWKRNVTNPLPEISRQEILNLIPRDKLLDMGHMDFLQDDDGNSINEYDSDITCSAESHHAESNLLRDILTVLQQFGKKIFGVT